MKYGLKLSRWLLCGIARSHVLIVQFEGISYYRQDLRLRGCHLRWDACILRSLPFIFTGESWSDSFCYRGVNDIKSPSDYPNELAVCKSLSLTWIEPPMDYKAIIHNISPSVSLFRLSRWRSEFGYHTDIYSRHFPTLWLRICECGVFYKHKVQCSEIHPFR